MGTTRSRTALTSEVARQVNENNRNIVIFALIAVLVLFGWPLVMHKFGPAEVANPPATKIEGGKTKVLPNPGADPAVDSPKATQDRASVIAGTPRVAIDTPTLKGSINLRGARIDDLVLRKYAQTIAKDSPPIRLLSPSGAPGAYFASFGWRGQGLTAPGPDTVWQASSPTLAPGHPVTLTADNGQGQRFRIDLAVDDQYMFTIRQSVANTGTAGRATINVTTLGVHTFNVWMRDDGVVLDRVILTNNAAFTLAPSDAGPAESATRATAEHLLVVGSGTGDGYYGESSFVAIAADPAPTNYVFDRWVGDTDGLLNVTSANTTLAMPAGDASRHSPFGCSTPRAAASSIVSPCRSAVRMSCASRPVSST